MRRIVTSLLWPVLLCACVALVARGTDLGSQRRWFFVAYAGLVVVVAALERLLPHERAWWLADGQVLADLAHTATVKGVTFALSFLLIDASASTAPTGARGPWPGTWPLAAQVALALVVAEFGLYWAHRLKHEWRPLWPFHAVHHAVRRLWFVNTGRFHFADSLVSLAASQSLVVLSGAPQAAVLWVGYLTMFVGLLTHCNVEMHCGPLSWVFTTPTVHRWHHSRRPEEGNRNYGENLVVFDVLFGTFLLPRRRPPVDIGVGDAVPRGFLGQVAYPFRALARRRRRPVGTRGPAS